MPLGTPAVTFWSCKMVPEVSVVVRPCNLKACQGQRVRSLTADGRDEDLEDTIGVVVVVEWFGRITRD